MRIVWSFQARNDLREIRKFIGRDAPITAASFVRRKRLVGLMATSDPFDD